MHQNLLSNKQAMGMFLSLWLTAGTHGVAQDSLSKAGQQPYSLEVTPKLHTAGHSLYSGVYLNHHLNLEMNVTFKRKQIGAFMTKFVDFADTHSPINFATVGIFRSLQLSQSISVTPYVGCFFKQVNSFVDRADLWVGLVTKLGMGERFWIENTTLASNLSMRNGTTIALANRVNGAVLLGKFRLDAYAWYTHSLSTTAHFFSASLATTSPEWNLSPSVSVKVQVSFLQQIAEERPAGTVNRGVVMSLIVPMNCSRK